MDADSNESEVAELLRRLDELKKQRAVKERKLLVLQKSSTSKLVHQNVRRVKNSSLEKKEGNISTDCASVFDNYVKGKASSKSTLCKGNISSNLLVKSNTSNDCDNQNPLLVSTNLNQSDDIKLGRSVTTKHKIEKPGQSSSLESQFNVMKCSDVGLSKKRLRTDHSNSAKVDCQGGEKLKKFKTMHEDIDSPNKDERFYRTGIDKDCEIAIKLKNSDNLLADKDFQPCSYNSEEIIFSNTERSCLPIIEKESKIERRYQNKQKLVLLEDLEKDINKVSKLGTVNNEMVRNGGRAKNPADHDIIPGNYYSCFDNSQPNLFLNTENCSFANEKNIVKENIRKHEGESIGKTDNPEQIIHNVFSREIESTGESIERKRCAINRDVPSCTTQSQILFSDVDSGTFQKELHLKVDSLLSTGVNPAPRTAENKMIFESGNQETDNQYVNSNNVSDNYFESHFDNSQENLSLDVKKETEVKNKFRKIKKTLKTRSKHAARLKSRVKSEIENQAMCVEKNNKDDILNDNHNSSSDSSAKSFPTNTDYGCISYENEKHGKLQYINRKALVKSESARSKVISEDVYGADNDTLNTSLKYDNVPNDIDSEPIQLTNTKDCCISDVEKESCFQESVKEYSRINKTSVTKIICKIVEDNSNLKMAKSDFPIDNKDVLDSGSETPLILTSGNMNLPSGSSKDLYDDIPSSYFDHAFYREDENIVEEVVFSMCDKIALEASTVLLSSMTNPNNSGIDIERKDVRDTIPVFDNIMDQQTILPEKHIDITNIELSDMEAAISILQNLCEKAKYYDQSDFHLDGETFDQLKAKRCNLKVELSPIDVTRYLKCKGSSSKSHNIDNNQHGSFSKKRESSSDFLISDTLSKFQMSPVLHRPIVAKENTDLDVHIKNVLEDIIDTNETEFSELKLTEIEKGIKCLATKITHSDDMKESLLPHETSKEPCSNNAEDEIMDINSCPDKTFTVTSKSQDCQSDIDCTGNFSMSKKKIDNNILKIEFNETKKNTQKNIDDNSTVVKSKNKLDQNPDKNEYDNAIDSNIMIIPETEQFSLESPKSKIQPEKKGSDEFHKVFLTAEKYRIINENVEQIVAKKDEPLLAKKDELIVHEKDEPIVVESVESKVAQKDKPEPITVEDGATGDKALITEKDKTIVIENNKSTVAERDKMIAAEWDKTIAAEWDKTIAAEKENNLSGYKCPVTTPFSQSKKCMKRRLWGKNSVGNIFKTDPSLPINSTIEKCQKTVAEVIENQTIDTSKNSQESSKDPQNPMLILPIPNYESPCSTKTNHPIDNNPEQIPAISAYDTSDISGKHTPDISICQETMTDDIEDNVDDNVITAGLYHHMELGNTCEDTCVLLDMERSQRDKEKSFSNSGRSPKSPSNRPLAQKLEDSTAAIILGNTCEDTCVLLDMERSQRDKEKSFSNSGRSPKSPTDRPLAQKLEDSTARNDSFLKPSFCLNGNVTEQVAGIQLIIFKEWNFLFAQYSTEVDVWIYQSEWKLIYIHNVDDTFSLSKTCLVQDEERVMLVMLLCNEQEHCLQFLLFESDFKTMKVMEHAYWIKNRGTDSHILFCDLEGLSFATAHGQDGLDDVFVHLFVIRDGNPGLTTIPLGKSIANLRSLCKVRNLPHALMGVGESNFYIWHILEARLVTSMDLKNKFCPIDKCVWAVAENGIVFFLSTLKDKSDSATCQLLAVNVATGHSEYAKTYDLHPIPGVIEDENNIGLLGASYCEPFLVGHQQGIGRMWHINNSKTLASLKYRFRVTALKVGLTPDAGYLMAVGFELGCIHLFTIPPRL